MNYVRYYFTLLFSEEEFRLNMPRLSLDSSLLSPVLVDLIIWLTGNRIDPNLSVVRSEAINRPK